jgi:HSF-type DNA-binding
MLSENPDAICFESGFYYASNAIAATTSSPTTEATTSVILGKIVVKDRIKVENHILPKYFNHRSFASLRRQLK